jgi:hypothetical protein
MGQGVIYTRHFDYEFQMRDVDGIGDGRTVFGRVVPYGEVIEFVDPYDNNVVKRERFVKGALARQASMWHLVTLTFEHTEEGQPQSFGNTIGYGRKLVERDDGAYATFRLIERDADKARELMQNSHKGLSLEFLTAPGSAGADGVIDRRRVHVRNVACVPAGAYTEAEVLAIREDRRNPVATPRLDEAKAILADLRRWES